MRRARRHDGAPARAVLAGREGSRSGRAEIARRRRAVVLPVRATIRFERHAGAGIGHDERRRPATGITDVIARGDRADAGDARRGQRLGMPAPSRRDATCRRCSGSAGLAHSVSPDLPLEPRSGRRKRVHRNIFVDMHRLRMLSQIIKARKAPRAVTLERALASVFPNNMVSHAVFAGAGMAGLPDVPGQVLAPRKTEVAWRILGAIEPL